MQTYTNVNGGAPHLFYFSLYVQAMMHIEVIFFYVDLNEHGKISLNPVIFFF